MITKNPLQGHRVLDFGWVAAGPILGGLLACLGAEVIKVESRKRLDSMRFSPDNLSLDPERDPFFHSLNKNKLGITLDLTNPKAKPLILQLVEICDIVLENFSPGVMERFGLGYPALREANPSIIMISLPAVGMTGPWSDVVTYGNTLQALGGMESLIGYEGEGVMGMQQAFADYNAAIHGCSAVLAALYHRKKTSKGQFIEVAQLESLLYIMGEPITEYTMGGKVPGPQGNFHPTMAPHGNYPCKGEDKWISIGVKTEEEWKALCQVMANPDWTKDEKFSSSGNRVKHHKELDQHLAEWTRNFEDYEVMEMLQEAGVAAMPCLDTQGRFLDPHMNDREVYIPLEHPVTGIDYVANIPWKMSETPGEIKRHCPLIGEHNRYVFGELLGLTEEEIANLENEDVLL